MDLFESFMALAAMLGFFFIALLLAWPLGHFISKRLDPWPERPMENSEKKAAWALKYHQATPVKNNHHPWCQVQAHGTGITKGRKV